MSKPMLIFYLWCLIGSTASFQLSLSRTTLALRPSFGESVRLASSNDINEFDDDRPDHSGKVAIIIGGSRGIGKGIALECGLAGMTVYVAGRSTRTDASSNRDRRDLGEANKDSTVERTAEEIIIAGGEALAVPCDVTSPPQIASLMSRVREERGRCDLLVYSAISTPPSVVNANFRDDFWKQGELMWDAMMEVGLKGAYLACCEAVPLFMDTVQMDQQNSAKNGAKNDAKIKNGAKNENGTKIENGIENKNGAKNKNGKYSGKRPLIVLVSSFGGRSYTFNVAYGVAKSALDRLAADMSVQLRPFHIDTLALYPGVVRTEGNLQMLRNGEWDEASGGLDLVEFGETTRFSGRAVVRALHNPELLESVGGSGSVAVVAELAKRWTFTDEEGRCPPSIRSLRYLLPNFVFGKMEEKGVKIPEFVKASIPDYLISWDVFSGGPPPED